MKAKSGKSVIRIYNKVEAISQRNKANLIFQGPCPN